MEGPVKDLEARAMTFRASLAKLVAMNEVLAPHCAELIDLIDDFLEKWKAVEGEAEEAE